MAFSVRPGKAGHPDSDGARPFPAEMPLLIHELDEHSNPSSAGSAAQPQDVRRRPTSVPRGMN